MADILTVLFAAAVELTSAQVDANIDIPAIMEQKPLAEIQTTVCGRVEGCIYEGYVAPPYNKVTYPKEWTLDVLKTDLEKQSKVVHLISDYLMIQTGKMDPSASCEDNVAVEFKMYEAQKEFLEYENERLRIEEAKKLGLEDKTECKSSEDGVMICSSPMSRHERKADVHKFDLGKYFTACDPSKKTAQVHAPAPGIVNDNTKSE